MTNTHNLGHQLSYRLVIKVGYALSASHTGWYSDIYTAGMKAVVGVLSSTFAVRGVTHRDGE